MGATGDAVDEVIKGVADVAFLSVGQARTGYDIAKSSMVLFSGATINNGSQIFMELLKKFPDIEKEYKGLKVLNWMSGIQYQLLSRKPVKTLDDMKGMRVKTVGEIVQVLKALGVEGVAGPMPEAYMNIQKGIWDGVFSPYSQLQILRLAEVAKYATLFNLYRTPSGSRMMCLTTWNKLPPDIKKVFEDNIAWFSLESDRDSINEDDEGRDFGQKHGVSFFSLSKDDMAKFNGLMLQEAANQAKKLDAKGLPGSAILQEAQRLIKASGK